MSGEFIRIIREEPQGSGMEVLIAVNAITKIEVRYAEGSRQPAPPGHVNVPGYVPVRKGVNDPNAFRVYTIFVGGDKYTLRAKPGSKVVEVLEDIYKNAICDSDDQAQEK